MRFIHKTAVAGAAMVAFAGIGVGTALADPPSGVTPAATDIVGVGSDTTTPVFAGTNVPPNPPAASGVLQSDYNATNPTNKLYSWNAVGSPTSIVTKAGCAAITRPNGSSAGITALKASIAAGNTCIDFSRSSRARNSGDGTGVSFVSLARDAITWSSPSGSPAPASLTIAQLTAIYNCTDTNWSQVGGGNAPIVAVLPQNGSGTRATFLADIGGGVNNPLVPGSCVVNGSNSAGPIEENTGVSSTGFGNTTEFANVDVIFPYSIGDYIAQTTTSEGTYAGKAIGNHTGTDFGHGPMVLHETGGVAPTTTTNTSPYAGNAVVINAAGGVPMQRLLFDVVRTGSPLESAGGLFSSTGFMCTNATAKGDIASYGFANLGSNCGSES
jgi:ABC-type phosphate transport system substrate-binding protein